MARQLAESDTPDALFYQLLKTMNMTTPETLYNTARAYCDQNKLSIISGKLRVSQVMAFARDVHAYPIATDYYKVWDKIESYMNEIRTIAESKRIERIQQNFPQARIF